jgi:hypothetical protein
MSQAFCKLKGLLIQKKSDGSSCINFRTQKNLFEEAKFSECSQGELLELIPLILGNVGEKDKRNWCVGENKPSLKVCSESGVKLYAFYGRCSNHGSPPQSKEIARYSYKSSTKCCCKASFILILPRIKSNLEMKTFPYVKSKMPFNLKTTLELLENDKDRFVYSVLYDDSDARGDDIYRVVAAISWHDKLNTLKEGKYEKRLLHITMTNSN